MKIGISAGEVRLTGLPCGEARSRQTKMGGAYEEISVFIDNDDLHGFLCVQSCLCLG